jgi:putative NIF3 family GTP cyclohydrolase 1 type 2
MSSASEHGTAHTVSRDALVAALDAELRVRALGPDPSMSRFVPMVYDPIGVDWRARFTPAFCEYFNGLMLAGAERMGTVFCSVFPTPEVLAAFLAQGEPGDLLFLHHPIDMESGDPRGAWGRGFLPIDPGTLDALHAAGLSVYSCHIPLDTHRTFGTTAAMVAALDGTVTGVFATYGDDSVGMICDVIPTDTASLIARLKTIYRIPYIDFEGREPARISRIAVVAGGGDRVAWYRDAEAAGAQAYVTGEIHFRIDNDYGRQRFAEVIDYARETPLALLGVSHAASEYLVMETHIAPWLRSTFGLRAVPLPLSRWWR